MIDNLKPSVSSVASALRTISVERQALDALAKQIEEGSLGDEFVRLVELVVSTPGRVILTGMGKSGLIARKISATLASTGTPSFFLHPGEASHGDLGMIARSDVVIALSWSGETSELADVLNYCARFAVKLVAITAGCGSTLARSADLALALPRVQEACPNDLAPTSSTTVQAALGDALAVAAIERRSFSPDDFHALHPRGQLGARLVRVADIMAVGDTIPHVGIDATIAEATLEMSAKRFGITAVTEAGAELVGAFSDGDLRRSLASGSVRDPVRHYMTTSPRVIQPTVLASEALAIMNAHSISQLFVCEERTLVGIVHVHDVIRVGVA